MFGKRRKAAEKRALAIRQQHTVAGFVRRLDDARAMADRGESYLALKTLQDDISKTLSDIDRDARIIKGKARLAGVIAGTSAGSVPFIVIGLATMNPLIVALGIPGTLLGGRLGRRAGEAVGEQRRAESYRELSDYIGHLHAVRGVAEKAAQKMVIDDADKIIASPAAADILDRYPHLRDCFGDAARHIPPRDHKKRGNKPRPGTGPVF